MRQFGQKDPIRSGWGNVQRDAYGRLRYTSYTKKFDDPMVELVVKLKDQESVLPTLNCAYELGAAILAVSQLESSEYVVRLTTRKSNKENVEKGLSTALASLE